LALAGIVVVGGGFVGLARLDEEQAPTQTSAAGAVQKPGPPDVTIHAFDIGFREKRVTAAAGSITIAEIDEGEIAHTLLLQGVPGFELRVSGHGREAEGTVTLQPGQYTYYRDILGSPRDSVGELTFASDCVEIPAGAGGAGRASGSELMVLPGAVVVPRPHAGVKSRCGPPLRCAALRVLALRSLRSLRLLTPAPGVAEVRYGSDTGVSLPKRIGDGGISAGGARW
jgi:hypothetical protein